MAWRWIGATLLLLVVCLGGGVASASVARSLDLAELVRRSDRVAVVTALEQRASWDSYGRIVTDVTARVDELVKGDPSTASTLALRTLGGSIGDLGMRVEGEYALPIGERALVFLRRDASNRMRTVGLSQGVLRIERRNGSDWVHPGGQGLALQRRVNGQLVEAPAALLQPRPLRDVIDEIRSLMGVAR